MILPSSWKLPNPVSSQPSEQISDTSYAAESNATERPLVDYLHLGDLKNGFKTQPSETMSMLLQAEGGQRAFASVSPSLRHAHSTKPVAIISSSGVPFHSGAGSVAARAVLNQERGTFHKNRKEYPVYYTKQSLSGRRYASKLLPYTQRTNTGKERNRRQVTHSDPAHTAEATPVDSASIESASSRLSFSSALCFDCKQERHVLAADTAAGLPPRNRSAENSDDASAFPLLFSWNGRSSSSKNTASPQLSATSNASQHLNTELADQLQRWIAKAQSGSAVFHQLAGPPERRKIGMGVEKKQQIEKPLRADIFSTLISQEDILRATVGVYRTIYLWQLLDRNDRNSTDSTGLPSFHSPCSWQGSRTFPNTVTEARRTSSSRLSSEDKNLGKQFGTTAFYVEPDASETSSVPAAPAFGDAYSQTVSSSPPGSQEFPRLSCDQSGTEHLPVWMATQMHLAHKRGEPLNPQYVQSSPDVWLLPFVFLRWLDMWKRQVTLQEEASRAGMEFSQEEKMLGDDEQRSTSAPVARQTDVQEGHGSDARAPDDKKGMKKRFLRKSSRQG
ncbi:hypothetical protein TGRUB_272620 [Toxoplasma gondii RUB]|uniref:Uncharacterized protein n=2 Tax=Toxoplasma gondii TaxID=5811 RepID=A0A086M5C7_TOXGO|nr:hypothetical protein TGP89_272620 [Toxoplasma gondii p89]KFG64095.1 hypothetical protein TGRUB_272620 [Toxoplasma gondii RUB]